MSFTDLQRLRIYMVKISSGVVNNPFRLESLLTYCWSDLSGSGDGGMSAEKISGRMENVEWHPPAVLKFSIERHGGLMCGSTRADIQRWVVDVHAATAELESVSYRQIRPRQSKLNIKPIAEEISSLICEDRDNPRLKWSEDRLQVRVCIGKIPVLKAGSAIRETLQNRRKRFRLALNSILETKGWEYVNSAGGIYGGPLFEKE